MSEALRVRVLERLGDAEVAALSAVLIDCVEGGAGVSFMLPLSADKARAYWLRMAASVGRGERIIFAAEDESGIVGAAQLVLDMPENQPHRAEVAKMLVHRRARRRGIGAALLKAVEHKAMESGRTLLVLDTVTASDGYRLYSRHGWQWCGEIPGYALSPDGALCPTTVFFKQL